MLCSLSTLCFQPASHREPNPQIIEAQLEATHVAPDVYSLPRMTDTQISRTDGETISWKDLYIGPCHE